MFRKASCRSGTVPCTVTILLGEGGRSPAEAADRIGCILIPGESVEILPRGRVLWRAEWPPESDRRGRAAVEFFAQAVSGGGSFSVE